MLLFFSIFPNYPNNPFPFLIAFLLGAAVCLRATSKPTAFDTSPTYLDTFPTVWNT
jgi:hypothetical protein